MKKYIIIFLFFFLLLNNLFITPSFAQVINLKEGLYKASDLNLPTNKLHTIQNNSPSEYVFFMIFDSNQIAQQLMQLNPQSEKYTLTPLDTGYEMLIVTNGEVTID